MIQWAYFPQSGKATSTALAVIQFFERHQKEIDSEMEGRYWGQSFLPPKAPLLWAEGRHATRVGLLTVDYKI